MNFCTFSDKAKTISYFLRFNYFFLFTLFDSDTILHFIFHFLLFLCFHCERRRLYLRLLDFILFRFCPMLWFLSVFLFIFRCFLSLLLFLLSSSLLDSFADFLRALFAFFLRCRVPSLCLFTIVRQARHNLQVNKASRRKVEKE